MYRKCKRLTYIINTPQILQREIYYMDEVSLKMFNSILIMYREFTIL